MTVKEIETLIDLLEKFTGQTVSWDTIYTTDGESEQLSFPIEFDGENGKILVGQRCYLDEGFCPYVNVTEVDQGLYNYCVDSYPPAKIVKKENEDDC